MGGMGALLLCLVLPVPRMLQSEQCRVQGDLSLIQPMISGKLVRLPTETGAMVQADEVLFELYAEDIWLDLEQAEALRDHAEAELNRLNLLATQGKPVEEAVLSAARLEFSLRETQVAVVEEKVEQHRIRSPLSGVLSDLSEVHLGEWVLAGQRLAVVAEGTSDQVYCRVPALVLGRVQVGQAGEAWIQGSPYGIKLSSWGTEPDAEGIQLWLQLEQEQPHGQPVRLWLWQGWSPLWRLLLG